MLCVCAALVTLYRSLCFDFSHCVEVRTQVQLVDTRKKHVQSVFYVTDRPVLEYLKDWSLVWFTV